LNDIYVLQLRFDYLLHIAAFLPWAIFVYLLFSKHWAWAFSGLIFAGITESFQLYLPYRTFNINDLIANLSGIIAGYLIIMILRKQITNFKMNIHNHK